MTSTETPSLLADGNSPGRVSPGVCPERTVAPISGVTPPAHVGGCPRAPACAGPSLKALTELENLWECWRRARRNKAQRPSIQRFAADPLYYLSLIQERLRARRYTFGPYKTFVVREKKHRDVVDAPMKDRIVHWMLYRALYPIWEHRFIPDTYGNLVGRGTHAAIYRLADLCRRPKAQWVLQLDISKYFYSVRHDRLKERTRRYIGDEDLRRLIADLIDSYSTDARYDALFPFDSAYHRTKAKGMPIGNLSSQLFANIFLAEFDRWATSTGLAVGYMRYVDDMIWLAEDKCVLREIASKAVARLNEEGLIVHPNKMRLAPVKQGIPFLGYRIDGNRISVGARIRAGYLRCMKRHRIGYECDDALQSYYAMLAYAGRNG